MDIQADELRATLEKKSLRDLKRSARKHNIPDCSRMTKDELVEELVAIEVSSSEEPRESRDTGEPGSAESSKFMLWTHVPARWENHIRKHKYELIGIALALVGLALTIAFYVWPPSPPAETGPGLDPPVSSGAADWCVVGERRNGGVFIPDEAFGPEEWEEPEVGQSLSNDKTLVLYGSPHFDDATWSLLAGSTVKIREKEESNGVIWARVDLEDHMEDLAGDSESTGIGMPSSAEPTESERSTDIFTHIYVIGIALTLFGLVIALRSQVSRVGLVPGRNSRSVASDSSDSTNWCVVGKRGDGGVLVPDMAFDSGKWKEPELGLSLTTVRTLGLYDCPDADEVTESIPEGSTVKIRELKDSTGTIWARVEQCGRV